MSDPTGLPEDSESTVRRSDLTPPPAPRGAGGAARLEGLAGFECEAS